MDVQAYAKYNGKHRYITSVIAVFKKFQNLISVKRKCWPSVASAFLSIFYVDSKYSRRPVWARNDKGKEFLNKEFQVMLGGEGEQFQVCINPDVKYVVVERAHRTITTDN